MKELASTKGDSSDAPERTGVFTSGIVSTRDGQKIALFFTGRKHAGEEVLGRHYNCTVNAMGAPRRDGSPATATNVFPPWRAFARRRRRGAPCLTLATLRQSGCGSPLESGFGY